MWLSSSSILPRFNFDKEGLFRPIGVVIQSNDRNRTSYHGDAPTMIQPPGENGLTISALDPQKSCLVDTEERLDDDAHHARQLACLENLVEWRSDRTRCNKRLLDKGKVSSEAPALVCLRHLVVSVAHLTHKPSKIMQA